MAEDDNDAKPSRDARIDMAIPESFHRVKRTLIVLCSILILLAVAKPKTPGDAEINMQLLSLHVPMVYARILLWLSALYYAVGLWLEADTARRVNTHLFDGGLGSFQEALEVASQRIRRKDDTVNFEQSLATDARSAIAHIMSLRTDMLTAEALRIMELKLLNVANAVNLEKNPRETMLRILREIIAETPSPTTNLQQSLQPQLELVERRLARYDELIENLDAEVRSASSGLTKLSNKIAGSRRASFWYWEIGCAYALFGLATAATIAAHFGTF